MGIREVDRDEQLAICEELRSFFFITELWLAPQAMGTKPLLRLRGRLAMVSGRSAGFVCWHRQRLDVIGRIVCVMCWSVHGELVRTCRRTGMSTDAV